MSNHLFKVFFSWELYNVGILVIFCSISNHNHNWIDSLNVDYSLSSHESENRHCFVLNEMLCV